MLLAGAAIAICGTIKPARALDTTIGDWQVNLDTTLSSSVDIRTSPQDPRFIGLVNGGKFYLPSEDNGTLNYRDGSPVAATQRITTELQIKREDYGVFVRATGFYDPVTDSERTDFQPLTRAAVRDIGADLRLLDAYVFARPSIFGHPVDVRIGSQALNWGESTFIQFGINSIAPLDTTALRTPGAELRQGILPIPVIDLKTEIVPNTSLEGFWQFLWTRTRGEPKGSFFSTNDNLSDGGTYGLLFDNFPDSYSSVNALNAGVGNALGAALPRSVDRHPNALDEFGLALRQTVTAWNDAEFGLYFENYHSRIPFASYRTGSASSAVPSFLASAGLIPGAPSYTSTTSYFADYPKDIHLIGFSWNLQAPGGIAVQGEISHRLNQPIQLAVADSALAVNAPAACELGQVLPFLGLPPQVFGQFQGLCAQAHIDPAIQAMGGVQGFHQIFDGWKRYPVTQLQSTATKLFGAMPSAGINSITLVGEIGFDYVHNFGPRGIYNANYTTDTNSAFVQAATVNGGAARAPLSTKGLVTQFSGAYTWAAIFDMPNVLPYGIDMKPTLTFQHDFVGTSPYGVNVFQENTAAASVGVTFNYLQAWSLGLQYTNHFPIFDGGKYYGLLDRDFASAALSYEF
jgi:hypothetical protein